MRTLPWNSLLCFFFRLEHFPKLAPFWLIWCVCSLVEWARFVLLKHWLAIERFVPVSRATRLMYSSQLKNYLKQFIEKYQINGHRIAHNYARWSNLRGFSLFCTMLHSLTASHKNSIFRSICCYWHCPVVLSLFNASALGKRRHITMFEHLFECKFRVEHARRARRTNRSK